MPRKSKIYQLDEVLIAQLNECLLAGKLKTEAIRELINNSELNNGVKISHAGLMRYKKRIDASMKDLQALDHLLQSSPNEVGFSAENKIHRLIYRLLSKAVLDASMGSTLNSKQIMELARSTKDLMSSIKDREKIKSELEKEIKTEQVSKLDKEGKKLGIPNDALVKLKQIMSE